MFQFEFRIPEVKEPRLSLATMFVQSNDVFFAPDIGGISLFDGNNPIDREVTGQMQLWDARTEQNQPPGEGADQAPRQSEPGAGAEEDGNVRRVGVTGGPYSYPPVAGVMRVTVSAGGLS